MEDLKRRWSVTYTKHLKQKRKVYQDGFLDLHVSANKVKLYDECDNLLECRILKKDEVIGSGETLTFNAYIVDVGDPEGDLKPSHDSSFHVREKNTSEKPGLMHGQKFRSSSIDPGARTINSKNNIARRPGPNNTSPSQKLIRDFRKSELQKYGAPQSSPGTPKLNIREWQVLYTTQVTQKAKKYHDGFLQLESFGSLGRQIMLYDATRKLLDSRFLKKDEIIRSGESILYDTHIVDIGEPEEECKPLEDLVIRGSNGNILGKREATFGQQNCVLSNDSLGGEFKKTKCKNGVQQSSSDTTSTITEWQVTYTTQMTQKAKKYHDGFLQLKTCGSLGRQLKLFPAWYLSYKSEMQIYMKILCGVRYIAKSTNTQLQIKEDGLVLIAFCSSSVFLSLHLTRTQ
ncbi:uncharacterized protein LOC120016883 isoform X2 [Tripterygium wilfordii]|uniref:uncharacterized protein LOC120016883 isoform X2 n=1 Tax=Tripterygium wilfordii TaxID=458696 RepID=UPI0018F7F96D|nr:uncharacterized protein LOC120016883 isoform X2 [Tripterygium wilfordii]